MNLLLFIISACVIGWITYQYLKGLIKDDPDCGWRKTDKKVESLRDYTDKYK